MRDPDPLARVRVGDRVEVLVERIETVAASEPELAPEPPPAELPGANPEIPPATREVLQVWRGSAGRPIEARIAAWEDYLERTPDSPYAAAIREDPDLLHAERERIRPVELSLEDHRVRGIDHAPPTRARPGQPIDLVFVLEDPGELTAAWLHYRTRGADHSGFSGGLAANFDW